MSRRYELIIFDSKHIIVEWHDGSASYFKSLFDATESIKRDYEENGNK